MNQLIELPVWLVLAGVILALGSPAVFVWWAGTISEELEARRRDLDAREALLTPIEDARAREEIERQWQLALPLGDVA